MCLNSTTLYKLFTLVIVFPTHTYYESNGVVYVLAQKALEASDFIVWMEDVPLDINCIISAIHFNKISNLILKKKKKKEKKKVIDYYYYIGT